MGKANRGREPAFGISHQAGEDVHFKSQGKDFLVVRGRSTKRGYWKKVLPGGGGGLGAGDGVGGGAKENGRGARPQQ